MLETNSKPISSVQKWCDRSMSATFNTRWLTPAGRCACVCSLIVPPILAASLRPASGASPAEHGPATGRPSPLLRAEHAVGLEAVERGVVVAGEVAQHLAVVLAERRGDQVGLGGGVGEAQREAGDV